VLWRLLFIFNCCLFNLASLQGKTEDMWLWDVRDLGSDCQWHYILSHRSWKWVKISVNRLAAVYLLHCLTACPFCPFLTVLGAAQHNHHSHSFSPQPSGNIERKCWRGGEWHCSYWSTCTWYCLPVLVAKWGLNDIAFRCFHNVAYVIAVM
jgi:hypothetical protein